MDLLPLTRIKNFIPISNLLATAGQPTEKQLSQLAHAGFQTVINLALHNDLHYSLPDEAGLVKSLGMEYIHIPVLFHAPEEANLLAFLRAMEAQDQRKVLVHCAENKRVPVFLALYRIIKLGWSTQEALSDMRSVWKPNEVWQQFISHMLRKHEE